MDVFEAFDRYAGLMLPLCSQERRTHDSRA